MTMEKLNALTLVNIKIKLKTKVQKSLSFGEGFRVRHYGIR